jgi:hypothetical protein
MPVKIHCPHPPAATLASCLEGALVSTGCAKSLLQRRAHELRFKISFIHAAASADAVVCRLESWIGECSSHRARGLPDGTRTSRQS